MVGSSKILTVSYGTFSCTLEGFDDSFETMKAIAEYFRDLAADDRYFGAEPPTPDAEMLARIAQREITRRVEAHEHQGRIVLKAQDDTVPVAPVTPATAHAAAAVNEQAAPPEFPQDALQPEGLEAEDSGIWQDEDVVATGQTTDQAQPSEATQAVEADSLAAKLNLIRSVVGGDTQYSEDEHAQDFAEPDAMKEPLWTDSAEGDADAAQDDIASVAMPEFSEQHEAEKAIFDDEAPEADAFDEADSAIRDEIPALADAPDQAVFEDTLAALMADAAPGSEAAFASGIAHHEHKILDDEAAMPDARVLKVRREDFDAALADDIFDETTDEMPDVDHDAASNIFDEDDSDLSPEEEEELQRELAELEAELLDEEPEIAAQTPPAPEQPERDLPADVAQDSDLERIFDKAASQMAAPETSRRRNTIQHLRAALAATRAEKEAGADLNRKIDDSPYRGDLAAVVRPRRPERAATTARGERPAEVRPAPLKLVAEQRVDAEHLAVRPRRVATPQPEVFEATGNGFAEFAEEQGATALPDLLEAAAAYLADVEGRTQFSRPMLMGKLREVDEAGFSREEGLRSFGKLLREGKLQKLSGGRFAVTEETEFRASGRRRAG